MSDTARYQGIDSQSGDTWPEAPGFGVLRPCGGPVQQVAAVHRYGPGWPAVLIF